MENMTPNDHKRIYENSDAENLKFLCDEILAAPILKEYRPKIYNIAKINAIKKRPSLQPCCGQQSFYCQCNAD